MFTTALKTRFRRSQGFVGRKTLTALCCAPLLLLSTSSLADAHCDVEVLESGGFAALQTAVSTAESGSTICVEAGTYTGNLDVQNTEGLTLLGARHGVSAGPNGTRDETSTLGETILQGDIHFGGGGTPTVLGLTIDGFRLENTRLTNNGARLMGTLRIANSIVFGNSTFFLISVGTPGGPHQLQLVNSNINNQRGFSIGNANVSQALIHNNVFNTTAASTVSASSLDGVVTVTNNVFNSPRAINILSNGGTYTGNTFNISEGSEHGALDIWKVTDNVITGNTFNILGSDGSALRFVFASHTNARDEEVLNNTIVNNVISPAVPEGEPPVGAINTLEQMVDLRGNFWSDPSGPQVLELPTARNPRYNNVDGFGPSVSSNIQFWPWCTAQPDPLADPEAHLGARCPLEHQVPVTPFASGGITKDDLNTRYRTPEGQEPVQPPLFFDFTVGPGATLTDIVRVEFDFPADTAQDPISLGTETLVGPVMVGEFERTEIRTLSIGTVSALLSGQFASAVTVNPSSQQVEFDVDESTFTLRVRSRRQEGRLRATVSLDGQASGFTCTFTNGGTFNSGDSCTVDAVSNPATLQFVITR
jgi:hypothetical protein